MRPLTPCPRGDGDNLAPDYARLLRPRASMKGAAQANTEVIRGGRQWGRMVKPTPRPLPLLRETELPRMATHIRDLHCDCSLLHHLRAVMSRSLLIRRSPFLSDHSNAVMCSSLLNYHKQENRSFLYGGLFSTICTWSLVDVVLAHSLLCLPVVIYTKQCLLPVYIPVYNGGYIYVVTYVRSHNM